MDRKREHMRLFIAEKPSVGRELSQVLPNSQNAKRHDGYIVQGDDVITWGFGHMLEQVEPGDYDEKYKFWRFESLPILPTSWKLKIKSSSAKQFKVISDLFKKAMSKYPPDSRSRGFEASTFQTCIIGELQKAFPSDWKFWKYKRFALSMKGYSFLIKKLDKKEMPMNIRTQANKSILNQVQTLIFDPTAYENPIIFFGWQKSKFGELMAPHFVYIDEEKIQWRFYEEELTSVTIPTI